MIDFEQAKEIALAVPHSDLYELNPPCLVDSEICRISDGWAFGWRYLGESPDRAPAGHDGPCAFVVHRFDGHIEELWTPSPRAFEVKDEIAARKKELADN